MIRFCAGLLGCALLLAAALVRAQEAAPLLKHTFDEGDDGWAAVGVNARATIDRQYPLEGAGALKLEYDLQKGRFGVVSFQTPAGSLAGAKTFRFSAFADNSTTLALLVQIGSVTWMAPFVVNKGAWQKVEVSVDDLLPLAPAQDGAPLRPAMEQTTALSVGDAAVLIGLLGNDDIARLLGIVPGPRMLRLDSFSVSTEALPGAYTARDGTI